MVPFRRDQPLFDEFNFFLRRRDASLRLLLNHSLLIQPLRLNFFLTSFFPDHMPVVYNLNPPDLKKISGKFIHYE